MVSFSISRLHHTWCDHLARASLKDGFGVPTSFPKTLEERFEGQPRRLPQGSGMHVSRRSNEQRAKVLDSWRRCYLPWL